MAVNLNNLNGMFARARTAQSQKQLQTSFNRLSSGLRINSAADDAAGLAISEGMRSQIRSYNVAERNTLDGVSMAQTAEGALGGVSEVLGRMRELAMQSANGSLNDEQRGLIDAEFSELQGELDRIQGSAKYNGVEVAGSATTSVSLQVGLDDDAADQITVDVGGVDLSGVAQGTASVGSASGAQAALGQIDAALSNVSQSRSNLGATINRLDKATDNIQTMRQNLAESESRIRDADVAGETSRAAQGRVLTQAGISVQAQANLLPQQAIQLLGG